MCKLTDGTLDHHAPFIFDAESIAADDLSIGMPPLHIVSQSREPGQAKLAATDTSARATFAKERIFGGRRFFELTSAPKLGASMLRPYK